MKDNVRARTGSATRELVEWAAHVELDAIPREVAARAARVVADNLAAIVAARDEPEVRCFHDHYARRLSAFCRRDDKADRARAGGTRHEVGCAGCGADGAGMIKPT